MERVGEGESWLIQGGKTERIYMARHDLIYRVDLLDRCACNGAFCRCQACSWLAAVAPWVYFEQHTGEANGAQRGRMWASIHPSKWAAVRRNAVTVPLW